jgi:hypothetical protein
MSLFCKKKNTDKKLCPKIRVLRTERLNEFRHLGYKFLADAIRASSGSSAELELLETITEEGKEYQIEVTAFWDDKPDKDIRVTADVLPVPLQPLFGFIPISIYFGEAGDEFIIRPDGSFVDE